MGVYKMKKDEFIKYAKENLISTREARSITEQTIKAFQQSVKNEKIIPAIEIKESEKRVIRLFFKDEVEAYKDKMNDWQAARKK
ncbi:hypothetical protein HB904_17170 [Listeria booriae]|uniref:Uncharacterized protein n=2 Tax=Listeria booriae TaxID=1552123 RepID=A0A841YQT4_9LIST|nr:hypothetical protein [Listeria booriae]MBC1617912.1 hypothetical protein [Listeria booriae]MBC1920297.1 hypothetical protein [Listeria booriae]